MEAEQSNSNISKRLKLAAFVAAGAMIVTACNPEQSSEPKTLNLIENSSWNQGGVTPTPNSLEIHAQDRAIVQQSGEAGEVNPSINLYGTVLEHEGDFSVSLTIDNRKGPAEIMLYGEPPIVSDEFRSEQETLRVVLADNRIRTDLSNETEGDVIKNQRFDIDSADQHKLTIVSTGNKIKFLSGNTVVGEIDDHGIFKTGNHVWFGINTRDPAGSFDVTSLTARGENGDSVALADTRKNALPKPDANSLFRLAQKKRPNFQLGTAVATGPMVADTRYRERLFNNFNTFTTENAGKWQFIHPKAGNRLDSYDFSEMDAIVEMAERSGSNVHGHTLIFGEANPLWLQDLADNPAKLKKAAIDHITTVMKRYKGKIKSWDVINEPLADYETPAGEHGLRKNIWYEALGPDYTEIFLRAAHEADPEAELWVNDSGMESDDDRFNDMLAILTRLKANGVPLTGVGFQSHIDEWDTNEADTHIDTDVLRSRIQDLAQLGLKTRFSEVDISNESEHAVPSDIVKTCIGEKACKGVTFWGVTDSYSSGGEENRNGTYSPGFGLPWDANYRPTHIVKDLQKTLK